MVIKIGSHIINKKHEIFISNEKKTLIEDEICAFLLALSPILQHYQGIFEDLGITVLLITCIWYCLKLFRVIRNIRIPTMILGLLIFQLYKSVIHGSSFMGMAYAFVMIFIYVVASTGLINLSFFMRASCSIATLASILILVQYACYYLLGFHLQLVPTKFLLSEAEQWILGAQTGLAGITGKIGTLYRPSAFFFGTVAYVFVCIPTYFYYAFYSGEKQSKNEESNIIVTRGSFDNIRNGTLNSCFCMDAIFWSGKWEREQIVYKKSFQTQKFYSCRNFYSFCYIRDYYHSIR